MSGERQLVSGYVWRRVEAVDAQAAVAAALGVPVAEVVPDDDSVLDPVAFVEVLPEPGEYPTRMNAFVDARRAPRFSGKPQLLAALAHALAAPILYDDGGSTDPSRWVRVDPDGSRYEVFEDPDADELRIDRTRGARALDTTRTR